MAFFDAACSAKNVWGDDLPKFDHQDWPPPLRKTVNVMRDFLAKQWGDYKEWTEKVFSAHRTYFNHVFNVKLDGTKV